MSKLVPTLCIIVAFALGWVSHMRYESYRYVLPPHEATAIPQTQDTPEYPPLPEGAINDLR